MVASGPIALCLFRLAVFCNFGQSRSLWSLQGVLSLVPVYHLLPTVRLQISSAHQVGHTRSTWLAHLLAANAYGLICFSSPTEGTLRSSSSCVYPPIPLELIRPLEWIPTLMVMSRDMHPSAQWPSSGQVSWKSWLVLMELQYPWNGHWMPELQWAWPIHHRSHRKVMFQLGDLVCCIVFWSCLILLGCLERSPATGILSCLWANILLQLAPRSVQFFLFLLSGISLYCSLVPIDNFFHLSRDNPMPKRHLAGPIHLHYIWCPVGLLLSILTNVMTKYLV